MAHGSTPQKSQPPVPALPPDSENEALIDAGKTFLWAMLGAVGFIAAGTIIVLMTRMG